MSSSRPRSRFSPNTRIGLTSDVMNGFLGAAYGAYLGILMSQSGDLFLAVMLFILVLTNVLGAVTALNEEVARAVIAIVVVWGLNIEIMRIYPELVSLVILGIMLSTAWMFLIFPRILKSLGGAS